MTRHRVWWFAATTAVSLVASAPTPAAEPNAQGLKAESFDRDPQWEGHSNRVVPQKIPTVTQNFGYSATLHTGGRTPGEIGGRITRTTRCAYYAAPIEPKTLDDKLSASGSFAITTAQAGAGVFFGWFNANQPGGSGRPIGSLGLHFDFEQSGGRLAVRLLTGTNQGCGTFITPYLPGKYRTTPLKFDAVRYDWTLDYDPAGADGDGSFTFTLHSDRHPPITVDPSLPAASQTEERARFPTTTRFTVPLTPGFKRQGTRFDRFGVMNMMKSGGTATMYFGNLKLDGQALDVGDAKRWIGSGNSDTYEDRELVGAHNFGFSADSARAGGAKGEIGGDFWRSGNYGYYADRVGPLSLDDRLEARGRVTMVVGGPDADMMFGWFSSAKRDASPIETGGFLGVAVGGPTRVGHYFAPSLTASGGLRGKVDSAPILVPGRSYTWSLTYDPAGGDGHGLIRVVLGDESVELNLKPEHRRAGASLDRFGMFTSQAGGQMVRIYLDDLTYTAAARK